MSLWERLRRVAPYHAHFLASTNHAWLAVVTLGVGIAVASPLSITLGLAAYGLGIIFLPDLPAFRNAYDTKRRAEIDARQREESSTKERVRANLLQKLTPKAKARWQCFSILCTELQAKLNDAQTEN